MCSCLSRSVPEIQFTYCSNVNSLYPIPHHTTQAVWIGGKKAWLTSLCLNTFSRKLDLAFLPLSMIGNAFLCVFELTKQNLAIFC